MKRRAAPASIRLRLLAWLGVPLVLVNLAVAALAYLMAWAPARLAFDEALLDAVRTAARAPMAALAAPRADGGERTWTAVRARADGRLLAGAPALPAWPAGGAAGDAFVQGEPVRIAAMPVATPAGPAVLTVARTVRQRQAARSALLRSLALLEVLAILGELGLVWFSVTNGLAPLSRLRASLDRRDSDKLDPLPEHGMGSELRPVAAAFNALLERIAEGNRVQREFQANVAHQLRTPLAGMKLQLEWLASRSGDDAEGRAALARLLQANERLIRETKQLLSLARAQRERAEPVRLEPLDLARFVEDAVQGYVDTALARDIDLGFDLAEAWMSGDRFLLRDLLDNLVDNALRYTPPGGSVTVRTRREGDAALLAVEDSGPGIPVAQRAHVFQRFVRLDPATTGSGLGLAIARDIARLHGARIEVGEGDGGRGARFSVRFPG